MYTLHVVYVVIFLFLPIFLVALKCVKKLTTGVNTSYTCMVGKTVIITGATSGIGYYTALELAKRGARIILACRHAERAMKARERIIQETDNENIVYRHLDLESLASVREFAAVIVRTETRVDVLVNNAGAVGLRHRNTVDNLQVLMQTNYLAPFLLTNLLLGKLKENSASKPRIVNVSSVVARFVMLNVKELNRGYRLDPSSMYMYAKTKLCLILFTVALAKRLHGTNVTVNALHPGVVKTNIANNARFLHKHFWNMVTYWNKNVVEGAQTTIYLATAKEVADMSGRYFVDCKLRDHYMNVNETKAEALWTESMNILGLTKGIV